MAGVISRGVQGPIIREGDDIVDIDVKPGTRRPLEELSSWIVSNAPAKRIAIE